MFDGERSYKQISELILQQANIDFTEDDVKEFASYLEDQGELFYKTPLEKNITLKQKMSSERHKRGRFHVADVTDITSAHLAKRRRLPDHDQAVPRIYLHHLVHPADPVHVWRHGLDVGRQIRRNLERQFRLLQLHRQNHLGPGGVLVSVWRHGLFPRNRPRP